MTRVAIVSDTHVPSREPAIPEWVRREVGGADHVIHAGDFDTPGAYREVEALADDLTAVAGNTDPESMGLSHVERVRIGGVEFVVTHGTGGGTYYREGVIERVREHGETDRLVGISGHSHEVHDFAEDGIRFLNPGTATGAWPAEATTMMVAEVDGGDLDVEVLDGPIDA